ncbi:hypothetical protein QFZ97_006128 [Paraburkholderia youngii]
MTFGNIRRKGDVPYICCPEHHAGRIDSEIFLGIIAIKTIFYLTIKGFPLFMR